MGLGMKQRRQAVLVQLIESGVLDSQQQAVEELRRRGFHATQTTVSRDFTEIGAVRVSTSDGFKYVIHAPHSVHGASLERVLREFVLFSAASGNLIVVKTPPGHAGVVAAALDREEIPGILGVVAGDDTLFICCEEEVTPSSVMVHLGLA